MLLLRSLIVYYYLWAIKYVFEMNILRNIAFESQFCLLFKI